MSRVNLLPDEVRQQRRGRARARQIRFFGLCVLFLLAGLYAIRTGQIFLLRRDLDQVAAQQASVQAQLDELADVRAVREAVVAGRGLVTQLLRGEVSWSEQMLEVAQTVPAGFQLDSLSGQLTPDSTTGVIGSMTFTASSQQLLSAESWLIRIETQEGWANGWVSSVASEGTTFSVTGSLDLTADALSPRGGGPA